MGRIDGTSRNNDRPAGVTDSFQVRRHSVEPRFANRCRNLLSHDDRGSAGADEAMKVGPQVPWIVSTGAFARDGKRLAGAASSPQRPVVWPPGEAEGVGPPADPGEEMALCESLKFIRGNIDD